MWSGFSVYVYCRAHKGNYQRIKVGIHFLSFFENENILCSMLC